MAIEASHHVVEGLGAIVEDMVVGDADDIEPRALDSANGELGGAEGDRRRGLGGADGRDDTLEVANREIGRGDAIGDAGEGIPRLDGGAPRGEGLEVAPDGEGHGEIPGKRQAHPRAIGRIGLEREWAAPRVGRGEEPEQHQRRDHRESRPRAPRRGLLIGARGMIGVGAAFAGGAALATGAALGGAAPATGAALGKGRAALAEGAALGAAVSVGAGAVGGVGTTGAGVAGGASPAQQSVLGGAGRRRRARRRRASGDELVGLVDRRLAAVEGRRVLAGGAARLRGGRERPRGALVRALRPLQRVLGVVVGEERVRRSDPPAAACR